MGSLRWGGGWSLQLGGRDSPWEAGGQVGRTGRLGGLVDVEDILLLLSLLVSLSH